MGFGGKQLIWNVAIILATLWAIQQSKQVKDVLEGN